MCSFWGCLLSKFNFLNVFQGYLEYIVHGE